MAEPPVWADLAITGVLATAACFAIQTYVQQRLPAITSTLILSAEPVFAALFGCILLGERLGGIQMLGMALMIGGDRGDPDRRRRARQHVSARSALRKSPLSLWDRVRG